ncbi:MAG TPA: DNA recombination protein RmuC [Nitrospirota bacterium]|nr:DNA recombination protein RmuC [Nitrospirota bacterium]
MGAIGYTILGIIIGAVVTWLMASFRLGRLGGRVRGAEAVNEELRTQVQRRESEMDQVRKDIDAERQVKVEALTRLDAAQKGFEEQKALIETMKKEMTDTFNALSSAALKSSSEDFLRLASQHLGNIVTDTKGRLGEHQTAIDGLVKPLQEALKRYEEQINALEAKRRQDYGGLEEQIKTLTSTHQQLQRETSSLVTALRKPQVSGSWGQLSLKRTAELAGMASYCDFYEQVSVNTEAGRLRPDMIIRLPNGREIVVDAKAPVDAYLNATSASSEEERQKGLTNYVNQVRAHMNALGAKSYWEQFPKSPEIVVMFLPGESFFSAALEHDPALIEDSSLKKVVLATPTTFIALLKAIAYGWQQEQMTKNAQQISMLGKELYERISTLSGHFGDVGNSIEKAVAAYNRAVGSLESRVLPSVRRFKELGATGAEEIPVLEQIDQKPRGLDMPP